MGQFVSRDLAAPESRAARPAFETPEACDRCWVRTCLARIARTWRIVGRRLAASDGLFEIVPSQRDQGYVVRLPAAFLKIIWVGLTVKLPKATLFLTGITTVLPFPRRTVTVRLVSGTSEST